MVGRERHHAFGRIAVEFDIDAGQRDDAAADLLCARSAKRPKPPNGSSLSSVQRMRVAQRRRFHAQRAVDLERGLVAGGAVEREFHRRAGKPQLDAGALAGQRRQEIAQREARFDRLVVPDEAAIGAEAARDRRPGELEVDAVEPVDEFLPRI